METTEYSIELKNIKTMIKENVYVVTSMTEYADCAPEHTVIAVTKGREKAIGIMNEEFNYQIANGNWGEGKKGEFKYHKSFMANDGGYFEVKVTLMTID